MKSVFVFLLLAFPLHAATITADSASFADVQTAIYSSVNEDTVNIPAGSASWNGGIIVTQAITINGAGIGQTIFTDDWTGANDSLFEFTLVSGSTTRIKNISFQGGTHTPNYGVIQMIGDASKTGRGVIQSCSFTNVAGRTAIQVWGARGVTSGCYFSVAGVFAHDVWGPDDGDTAWAEDTNFGTDQFWFMEDCVFVNTSSIYECVDAVSGGKYVYRYNTLINTRLATHGSDSTTDRRSVRALEFYNNTLGGNGSASALAQLRGGTALYHNNTITNWNTAFAAFDLHAFRSVDGVNAGGASQFVPWRQADGTNAWDLNDVGNPFATGTATSGGTLTMTDTGASWTPDQWIGYTIHNRTSGKASHITDNTSDTITFAASRYVANLSFSASDNYAINLVTSILDQPGLGKGDLISTAGAPTWPNSAVEPIYVWGNTINGSSNNLAAADSPQIVANTHYFIGTAMPGYTAYTYPHPLVAPAGTTIRANSFNGGTVIFGP